MDFLGPPSWLSECCGAVAFGGLHWDADKVQAVGICSRCKDHATFMPPQGQDSHPAVVNGRLSASGHRRLKEYYEKAYK